jgi:3-hydroxybutyryl-CoA dehydrogenase
MKGESSMRLSDIKRVLVLGAGTMGQQIAFVCALYNYEVVLCDLSTEILERALKRIRKLGDWFVVTGKLKQEGHRAALGRISVTTDATTVAGEIDLVSESVPEDPELKARLFNELNAFCPQRTIFTTNTSMFVPSLFAAATGRPDRFAALHFHDVRGTNIVDIMPHPGTAPETMALIRDFARSIGQVAIVLKKENNGYVFNAMLHSLFTSALELATRNVVSVEDIDRAWMGVMRTPIGPFGLMDRIGISTVWRVFDYWAKRTGDPQGRANADFLRQYVDAGHLGFKSSKGFYTYPNPSYSNPAFLSSFSDDT